MINQNYDEFLRIMLFRVEFLENVLIYIGFNSEGLIGVKVFIRFVMMVLDVGKFFEVLVSNSDFVVFSYQYGKFVLIFDGDDQDLYYEYFRQVCLCLKDNGDIGFEFGQCVFDVSMVLEVGF